MALGITLQAVDEAIQNLNYRTPTGLKQRLLRAIRERYEDESDLRCLPGIDPAYLVTTLWPGDVTPEAVSKKRKNLSSIRSSVNADLQRLYREGGNPGGVSIGAANVFVMLDEAKDDALRAFKGSAERGEDVSLVQVAEVLGLLNDALKRSQGLTESGGPAFVMMEQVAALVQGLAERAGITGAGAKGSGGSVLAQGEVEDEAGVGKSRSALQSPARLERAEGAEGGDGRGAGSDPFCPGGPGMVSAGGSEKAFGEEVPWGDRVSGENKPEGCSFEGESQKSGGGEQPGNGEVLDVEAGEEVEADEEVIDAEEIWAQDELADQEGAGEAFTSEDLDEVVEDLGPHAETQGAAPGGGDELDLSLAGALGGEDEVWSTDYDELVEDLPDEEESTLVELDEGSDLEDIEGKEAPEPILSGPGDIGGSGSDVEAGGTEYPEVDALSAMASGTDEDVRKARLLAEEFDLSLATMDRFYNHYVHLAEGDYIVGRSRPRKNERPEQVVHLPSVYVGRFPVTNALFSVFVEKTGYRTTVERSGSGTVYFGRLQKRTDKRNGQVRLVWNPSLLSKRVQGACWYQPAGPGSTIHLKRNHPVVQVSIDDAKAFAAWTGKRLPTEAEWEAASRTRRGYPHPFGMEWKQGACNVEESCIGETTPVDQYLQFANELGIADSLGNVMEWTSDSLEFDGNGKGPVRSQIVKGGSWISRDEPDLCCRFLVEEDSYSNILGFRCVAW